ncbi:MAG: iron-containing alcohol dehydrogenase [archaeon]
MDEEKKHLFGLIDKYKPESDYLAALNIEIGQGILDSSFDKIAGLGKKVLFCTGSGSMKRLGFYDRYIELFDRAGIEVVEHSGIKANPTLEQIEDGVKKAKEEQIDFLLALGGGSIIDTAKAISVGIFGSVWDFVEKRATIKNALPIVANSTTSGTGSHVTPYAVITNSRTFEKKTLKDDRLLPKLSIIDIDITKHAPPYLVATTGFDVLCHALEVYTRSDCTKIAEEFALRSLELIKTHLVNSFNNNGIEHKTGMAYADVYAGIALAILGTHAAHAIAHPMSGRFPEITHGQALAYIMPKTVEVHMRDGDEAVNARFRKASEILGGAENCADTLNSLVRELGLDKPVVALNDADLDLIISDTLGYRMGSIKRSPSEMGEKEIREIVYESLKTR